MRTISKSSKFKADFKRMLKVPRYRGFEYTLDQVVKLLLAGDGLPESMSDHNLKGIWIGCRECHLEPDLLLIYRHDDDENTTLMRLGSHSELFG